MDNQAYQLPDGHDPLDIDAYLRPEARRYVVALGLIADATNENDATARSMVGIAIGLWSYAQIEAAFLGERIGALSDRMQALAALEDEPNPDRDAVCDWLKRATKLNARRNDLLHRPTWPGIKDEGSTELPSNGPWTIRRGEATELLRRSRRSHRVEPLGDQAEQLVRDLFASVEEGKRLLDNYLETEHARR
jgi:hypothetical protein